MYNKNNNSLAAIGAILNIGDNILVIDSWWAKLDVDCFNIIFVCYAL